MHNNQKGLTRLEETNLVLVVRGKNINTVMADEDYYFWRYNEEALGLEIICNNK